MTLAIVKEEYHAATRIYFEARKSNSIRDRSSVECPYLPGKSTIDTRPGHPTSPRITDMRTEEAVEVFTVDYHFFFCLYHMSDHHPSDLFKVLVGVASLCRDSWALLLVFTTTT